MQVVEPSAADECLPATQAEQTSGEDPHLVLENFPPRHELHADAPSLLENLPASHAWQTDNDFAPGVFEKVPTKHCPEHVEADDAPANFPASQSEQALRPATLANFPGWQSEQVAADADVAPDCPYLPAAHMTPRHEVIPGSWAYLPAPHNVQLLDEEGEYDPAEHALHVVAPVDAKYVPAEHVVHSLASSAFVYVPVVHKEHAVAPDCEYEPLEHDKHIAVDADVAPVWPYLPGAHKEPEHPGFPPIPPAWEFHVALNPEYVESPSEVKTICMYPVSDVYWVEELAVPESLASSSRDSQDVADEDEEQE
jgi:hypothetical protein